MGEIISLYIPAGLKSKIDIERGDIPRSRYVLKILEKYYKEFKDGR